jgi:hypothetical protein
MAELFRDSQIYFGVPKQGKLYFIQHMTPEAELPSLSLMVEANLWVQVVAHGI